MTHNHLDHDIRHAIRSVASGNVRPKQDDYRQCVHQPRIKDDADHAEQLVGVARDVRHPGSDIPQSPDNKGCHTQKTYSQFDIPTYEYSDGNRDLQVTNTLTTKVKAKNESCQGVSADSLNNAECFVVISTHTIPEPQTIWRKVMNEMRCQDAVVDTISYRSLLPIARPVARLFSIACYI